MRDALAVYYFPGMWDWDRAIVQPLALAAFSRAMQARRDECLRTREPSPEEEREWTSRRGEGEAMLRRYFDWAPAVDGFVPIRVDTEYDVPVPDPEADGVDLVAPTGEPVRLRGRVDVLVEDRSGGYWLVEHRIGGSAWEGTDQLLLDERSVTACWAWENFFLGMRIAGNVVNEVRSSASDSFRRTHVCRSPVELARAGARLALEVREQLDPATRIYPSPSPENCGRCAFVPPCLALNDGSDAGSLLASLYRRRPDRPAEEARIGRSTWAMSRGATLRRESGNGPS